MQPASIIFDQKQRVTPLKTDMKPKRSKTWDMKWHWLRDNTVLEQLILYWDKGTNNDADNLTKHLPTIHHRQI